MAQQELKLNQHYYPRTEADNTFAEKNHTHTGQNNDNYGNYSILLSTNGSTNTVETKRFTKNIGTDLYIYASVKQNGNIIQTGNVEFVANGVYKVVPISAENGSYFAKLKITWNQVSSYRISATYIGSAQNYSYCTDNCIVDVVSPYILETTNSLTNKKFIATVKNKDTNTVVNGVIVVFKINGQMYQRTTGANDPKEGQQDPGKAVKTIGLSDGTYSVTTSCFYNYTVGQQNFSQEVNQNTNTITIS